MFDILLFISLRRLTFQITQFGNLFERLLKSPIKHLNVSSKHSGYMWDNLFAISGSLLVVVFVVFVVDKQLPL